MAFNQKLYDEIREYEVYMQSEEWKILKKKRKDIDGYQCVLCKSDENLTCHHITYIRIYHEDINDLITLCSRCHTRIHALSPPKNMPDFTKRNSIGEVIKPTDEEIQSEINRLVQAGL